MSDTHPAIVLFDQLTMSRVIMMLTVLQLWNLQSLPVLCQVNPIFDFVKILKVSNPFINTLQKFLFFDIVS